MGREEVRTCRGTVVRQYLQWLLLSLGLLLATCVTASPTCDTQELSLADHTLALEDPTAGLTADEVLALPDSAFTPASQQALPPRYSHSAFWLRIHLQGAATTCKRWMTIGDSRLADIQVYVRQNQAWQIMQAGSEYPLAQWPTPSRQAIFPLELPASEELTVLVRVASETLIIIAPRLWSEQGLLAHRQTSYMVDGMTLGITLLMVPFSFVVGWILRSRLLVAHASSVLCYAMLVSAVNGYLIYLPGLLPWSWELIWSLSMVQYTLFLAYIRVLLQVRQLPPAWGVAYSLFLVTIVACYFWMWVDNLVGRELFDQVRKFSYLLIPATLLAGWRYRLGYSWLVYLVCGLLMLQGLLRMLELAGMPWQSADDKLSLGSTLPGLLLLACTLIMEVSRVRARERRALADLDGQQRAEHERLESTVAMRTRQLRDSLHARSLLMARISHDLRSPLVSIVNYARLLPKDLPQDYPRRIERSASRQLELIDELLEFSRSELHQLEIVLAPGYLWGFLREIEEEGGFLAAQQNNRFESRLDPSLPTLVQADFRRLRQILINLLANAAKFTRDGRILFEVQNLDCNGDAVRLRFGVRDTGIGIPADERKHLLQPFWRGREAERFSGTGLGLSTVSELLQQMSSCLSVDESLSGAGFSFEVQFALAREEDLDVSFDEGPEVRVSGFGRHVLLVDDVEQNREWLSDLLGGYGFDVTSMSSAADALDVLQDSDIDLLVTDQAMPGMDGWALLDVARQRWPSLPVLLYSSAPPMRPPEYPSDLSFDAVLLKPSDAAELLMTVERVAPARMLAMGDDS
ncbi:response regulator [Pseudomonas sp. PDM16]|nr:response regulator [Pseudomonas sp. PDM16]